MAAGVMDRVRGLTPDLSGPDAEAWVATLAEHAGDGPIGVTGYCMGVRLAVRTAGQFPGTVAAVGGFHGGGLVTDDPASPHLAIDGSTAEYAFGHADQDRSMPLEAVEALERALDEAGRPHVNEVYAGAAHGYTMADTSMYDEAATERHFEVLRDLLDPDPLAGGPGQLPEDVAAVEATTAAVIAAVDAAIASLTALAAHSPLAISLARLRT